MTTPSKLHTELCESCMEIKPTGMTIDQHQNWKQNIGRRSAMERSLTTLNANFDLSLLTEKVCNHCVEERHANSLGLTIVERVTLEGTETT